MTTTQYDIQKVYRDIQRLIRDVYLSKIRQDKGLPTKVANLKAKIDELAALQIEL